VLTAHPTESRRRSVLAKLVRAADLLRRLDTESLAPEDAADLTRQLGEEVTALWLTDETRDRAPTVVDEVRNSIFWFDASIFWVVPRVLRELRAAVAATYPGSPGARPPLTFGSWVGGDRDGNPNVTPAVTAAALDEHQRMAIRLLRRSIEAMHAHLSVALARGVSPELEERDELAARSATATGWSGATRTSRTAASSRSCTAGSVAPHRAADTSRGPSARSDGDGYRDATSCSPTSGCSRQPARRRGRASSPTAGSATSWRRSRSSGSTSRRSTSGCMPTAARHARELLDALRRPRGRADARRRRLAALLVRELDEPRPLTPPSARPLPRDGRHDRAVPAHPQRRTSASDRARSTPASSPTPSTSSTCSHRSCSPATPAARTGSTSSRCSRARPP
jgi:hypothetical protein